ncbi:MAG: restriction endonuclease [Deltaproteobacteria bacterium]|nr:restriction endonuclease [Deltaproteobacteria bacterium]
MTIDQQSLYELTPNEFEKLCGEILKAQGFDRIELVGGPRDQGVDIVGETEGRNVVVQVKHTKDLSIQMVLRIIDQVQASSYQSKELLIMTSAALVPSHKYLLQKLSNTMTIEVMGQHEILKVLNEHPEIQRSQMATAQQRTIRQRRELVLGFAGAFASIIALIISGISFFAQPEKPLLQERIETVELAIGNLKDLEKQLTIIKEDMVETEKVTKAIEQEYAKAKELEKLTEEQYEVVKKALRSKSWLRTIFDYLLGSILGIAASLIASVIYSKNRQHRALHKSE